MLSHIYIEREKSHKQRDGKEKEKEREVKKKRGKQKYVVKQRKTENRNPLIF